MRIHNNVGTDALFRKRHVFLIGNVTDDAFLAMSKQNVLKKTYEK